jgi:tetratricopeptide (TPR) repeat protein
VFILKLSLISMLLSISGSLQAAGYCGELKNAYGPYDYTDSANISNLGLVETAHFTSNIEKLTHGNSGSLGSELAYTLAAFPNHHRALMAAGKLVIREKTLRPNGFRFSIECYFDRAIRFKKDDATVYMAYALYLSASGNLTKAIEELDIAVKLEPQSAIINYNLGLLYCKKKDFESARIYAEKAYRLGFPLPGLKNMLINAGNWREPQEDNSRKDSEIQPVPEAIE